MEYLRMDLNKRGIIYLEKMLKTSIRLDENYFGNELANEFLKRHDLQTGECFTFLPASIPEKVKYDFEGGSYSIDRIKSYECLTRLAYDYLKSGESNIMILHDCLVTAGDSWLKKVPSHIFLFNKQVYRWIAANDATLENISSVLHMVNSGWLNIGFFSSVDVSMNPTQFNIDQEMLKRIALNTVLVFNSAYDLDGFIFWQR